MLETKKLKSWSKNYWNHIKRNIGLLKSIEQEELRKTPIAVFGVGGLGGPLIEQLVRCGCENLVICDFEKFKESNLNRQICTRENLGEYKIDILEKFLKQINPDIIIEKYYQLDEKNISQVLESISIVALTLDDPLTSILISRECLKKNIPMIESWGIPYLFAWWFTSESVDYETCYGFKTNKIAITDLKNSKIIINNIKKTTIYKLMKFPHIEEIYNRENGTLDGMIRGDLALVSLAPISRIASSYLAFEIIFSGILKIKKKILAPNIVGYDYFRMTPIKFRI